MASGWPAHELRVEELARECAPELFVSLSHRVFRVSGETRRWTTAVLNAFVHEHAHRYLETLGERLREAGLTGGLAFFQGVGGGHLRRSPEALRKDGPPR